MVSFDALESTYRNVSFDEMWWVINKHIVKHGCKHVIDWNCFDALKTTMLFVWLGIWRRLMIEHVLVISVTISDASWKDLSDWNILTFD
ncbi:hypothetical protein [Candidatus Hodgkinia cicadicola]|uniref:hypothetical protein n=1 Tax=Candidatus Hodgkinia cicadicola TaxID=573658 RepID=UPI0024153A8C